MWKIIPYHAKSDEMLYFFTLNTAPLGVIEKHVKLLNLWFVYVKENECCNKWASVFVIVSNYTRRNNSVKAERVCGPFMLTRQRPQDIHAPYDGPHKKNNNWAEHTLLLYSQLFLFVSNIGNNRKMLFFPNILKILQHFRWHILYLIIIFPLRTIFLSYLKKCL